MRKLRHDEILRPDPSQARSLPKHPVSVIVEDVRSLHNVGSIFRTADAAGIEHLYLTGITGTPENHGLAKTALGSEETVPWSYAPDALSVIRELRARGYTVAVLEQTDSPSTWHHLEARHFPLALIVGNEVSGVSDATVEAADLALEIPQYGAKHSLNVSVAFGIALYGVVTQYRALQSR